MNTETQNILINIAVGASIAFIVSKMVKMLLIWKVQRMTGSNAPVKVQLWKTVSGNIGLWFLRRSLGFVAAAQTPNGKMAVICAESPEEARKAAEAFVNAVKAADAMEKAGLDLSEGGDVMKILEGIKGKLQAAVAKVDSNIKAGGCMKCGGEIGEGEALCNPCREAFEKWAQAKQAEIKAKNQQGLN